MTSPSGRPAASILPLVPTRRPGALRRLSALLALALAAACGGDGGSTSSSNPAPVADAVSPAEAPRGASEAVITVTGRRFVAQSVVRFNGADRVTELVSATELRARLTAADLAAPGPAQVTVATPAPGGGVSEPVVIRVVNPMPAVTSLAPATLTIGALSATVTVTGTGFVPDSRVEVNVQPRQTTYVSATELRVAMAPADLISTQEKQIYVINPQPGGGISDRAPLAMAHAVPAIASLSPASVPTGSPAFTLSIVGTGFSGWSRVSVGGTERQPIFSSPTELRVSVAANELGSAGALEVRVMNPTPGGGTSSPAALELRAPVPVITGLLDASTLAGQPAFTIYVNGTGFAANGEVRFDGVARPTVPSGLGLTQLQATLSAADLAAAGTHQVTVFNPAPGGGLSNAVPFVVTSPVPRVISVDPPQAGTGAAGATVTVTGERFFPASQVLVGGTPRPTTFLSATQLRVAIPAADLEEGGPIEVQVRNPAPGGGTSNDGVYFWRYPPRPVVTALSPTSVMDEGPALVVRVTGTGFVRNSVVRIELDPRPTRFVSATELEGTLSAADVRRAGTLSIGVSNPEPGGSSHDLQLEVRAPAPTLASAARIPGPGLSGYVLRVSGTGFRRGSTLHFDGAPRLTSYLGATQLETPLHASELDSPRSLVLTVVTEGPGGGVSNALRFDLVPPAPAPARSR